MKTIYRFAQFFALFFCGIVFQIPSAFAQIQVVAAENFYGEVAKELGGDQISVTSILQNPEQDPHLFTANPSIAKAISKADIVVYNGSNYDDWMTRLLSVSGEKKPIVMVVSELIGAKKGENPHIWYIPTTMSYYAQALSTHFMTLDPAHKDDYLKRLAAFQHKQTALKNTVERLKKKTDGLSATATEPVFNWMAEALGLKMHDLAFQWSIENESSPSPSAVKEMLDDLKNHTVRVLFYNAQVASPLVDRVKAVAEQSHVPVVGVTETQPPGVTYHQWMDQQLQALEHAL